MSAEGMQIMWKHIIERAAALLIAVALLTGCSSGSGMSFAKVGSYSPPPSLAQRPRLGVTSFAIDVDSSSTQPSAALGDYAADQMAQLLSKSGRFTVIGRQDFASMLDRQNLAGAVKPGQVVQISNIDGVEYVLVGSISNLNISKKAQEPGMVDQVKDFVTRAGAKKDVIVTATCGVGFSVIDPGTSDIVISNNSEFTRTAGAKEFGIDIMEDTSSVAAGAELPVNNADREKVIHLAVDDAIRKALPKIDRFLASRRTGALAATPTAPPSHTVSSGLVNDSATPAAARDTTPPAPATAPAAAPSVAPVPAKVATKTCPVCGAENDAAARFCKKCGSKL
jgi:curli biogenesis system outer membrane secretion channel CsgG